MGNRSGLERRGQTVRTEHGTAGKASDPRPGGLPIPQRTRHICTPVLQEAAGSAQQPPVSVHILGPKPPALLSLPSLPPSTISQAPWTQKPILGGWPISPVSRNSFVLNSTFLLLARGRRNTDYRDPANGFYKLLFSCHRTAFN